MTFNLMDIINKKSFIYVLFVWLVTEHPLHYLVE
jgi:hypothetical protein